MNKLYIYIHVFMSKHVYVYTIFCIQWDKTTKNAYEWGFLLLFLCSIAWFVLAFWLVSLK